MDIQNESGESWLAPLLGWINNGTLIMPEVEVTLQVKMLFIRGLHRKRYGLMGCQHRCNASAKVSTTRLPVCKWLTEMVKNLTYFLFIN